ncbi:MAG: cyclic nucleotide-binding domain-containing protein [Dehalococcoidia bacterium]|nr:cyclic nucleotide-binding domain-containing protein [Dehalococcoidia bacterium]
MNKKQTGIKNSLKASAPFQGLSDDEMDIFTSSCKKLTVTKGTGVFNEGQPARDLYIVTSGRIALEMRLNRPDGSVTPVITVSSLGPGESFGWSAMIEPQVFTLTAAAVENSELLSLEGKKLIGILGRNKETGYKVMLNVAKLLAWRLSDTREAFVYERSWLWREKGER